MRCGSRCPGGSRTTSRCPSSTCTSRCTRRWSGPAGRTARDPDPDPPDAPHRRVRHRRALAVQGGREGRRRATDAELAWLGRMLEWQKEMADPREFMEGLKIDLYRGPGLRVHAEGRRGRPAGRRHADRLRLRHPHRGRAPVHRRAGERPAGAARLRAADRRRGRGHDVEGAGRRAVARLAVHRPDPRGPGRRSGSGSRGSAARTRWRRARTCCSGPCASSRCRSCGCDRRGVDGAGGARPEVPGPRRAVRGDRRGPGVAAVGGLAAVAAGRPTRRRRRPRRSRPSGRCSLAQGAPTGGGSWSRAAATSGSSWRGAACRCRATRSSGSCRAGRACRVHRSDCPNVRSLAREPDRLIEVVVARRRRDVVRRRDPGRGARPDQAAARRRHGAGRPAREHRVGLDARGEGPHRDAAVHVRAGRHHAPVDASWPRSGASTACSTPTASSRAEAPVAPRPPARLPRVPSRVAGITVAEIGPGLLSWWAWASTTRPAARPAPGREGRRPARLRGRRRQDEPSLAESGGEVLVVPQFTLYGDTREGPAAVVDRRRAPRRSPRAASRPSPRALEAARRARRPRGRSASTWRSSW